MVEEKHALTEKQSWISLNYICLFKVSQVPGVYLIRDSWHKVAGVNRSGWRCCDCSGYPATTAMRCFSLSNLDLNVQFVQHFCCGINVSYFRLLPSFGFNPEIMTEAIHLHLRLNKTSRECRYEAGVPNKLEPDSLLTEMKSYCALVCIVLLSFCVN